MAFSAIPFRCSDTAPLIAGRFHAARQIREAVFCVEQGIAAELEWDEHDATCEHFLLTAGNAPIGTARLRPYGEGVIKIERMAVLKPHRAAGAGTFLMRAILMHLDGKAETLVLNAQTAVEGFYRTLGFTPEGTVFEEAGIPHIRMVLRR